MFWNRKPKWESAWVDEPCGVIKHDDEIILKYIQEGDIFLRHFPDNRLAICIGNNWYNAENDGMIHSVLYKTWFKTHRQIQEK